MQIPNLFARISMRGRAFRCFAIATAIVMIVLPFVTWLMVGSYEGMAVAIVHLFGLCPAYSGIVGCWAGRDIEHRWHWPLLMSLSFLVGAWCFYAPFAMVFVGYAFSYIIIGVLAMAIAALVCRHRKIG